MSGTSSDIPNFPHLLLYIIFHEIPSWAHYIFTQFTRPTAIPVPELCFRKSTSSPPSSSPLILTKKKKKSLNPYEETHKLIYCMFLWFGEKRKSAFPFPDSIPLIISVPLIILYLPLQEELFGKMGKNISLREL